ncbi:MAG: 50S ribosomal protein L3 [archaeon]
MGKFSHPRRGSRQFAPRNRAKSEVPRIRTWVQKEGKAVLGFAGYKVAMTHAALVENNPKSILVNQSRQEPITLIQVPPVKVIGVRYYLQEKSVGQAFAPNLHKDLGRTVRPLPKAGKAPKEVQNFDRAVIIVSMQPRLAGIGKKKPEIMEIALAGSSPDEQKAKALELLGTDLRASDVLSVGDYLDIFAVSKGRGFLGPVARMNVPLMSVKTKRSRRRPANIGSWRPKRVLWQTPMGGKTGYHQRCDYNKRIVAISQGDGSPFHKYGKVDGDVILLHGSIPGPIKRLVRMRFAARVPERVFDPQKIDGIATGGIKL